MLGVGNHVSKRLGVGAAAEFGFVVIVIVQLFAVCKRLGGEECGVRQGLDLETLRADVLRQVGSEATGDSRDGSDLVH